MWCWETCSHIPCVTSSWPAPVLLFCLISVSEPKTQEGILLFVWSPEVSSAAGAVSNDVLIVDVTDFIVDATAAFGELVFVDKVVTVMEFKEAEAVVMVDETGIALLLFTVAVLMVVTVNEVASVAVKGVVELLVVMGAVDEKVSLVEVAEEAAVFVVVVEAPLAVE